MRASTLVIRELPFVEAARALGVPTWRIISVHVLRNLVSPILVQGTFIFAYAIWPKPACRSWAWAYRPTFPPGAP